MYTASGGDVVQKESRPQGISIKITQACCVVAADLEWIGVIVFTRAGMSTTKIRFHEMNINR